MNVIRITAAFFYLGLFLFSSQLIAQADKRIKLLNATYVLINGDSVKINTLDAKLQQDIKERITLTCKRNIQVALASQDSRPAKAYFFIKNTLSLDSTFLPAHAALIKLYLNKKDSVKAYDIAFKAYKVTKSEKFLPIIAALETEKNKPDGYATLNVSEINDIEARAIINYVQGLHSYYQKNHETALTKFEQDLDNAYNLLGAATIKLHHQSDGESRDYLTSLLSDSLLSNIAAYQLAISAYKKSDFTSALTYLEKMIKADSAMFAAHYLRAHVLYQLGKTNEALVDFEICVNGNYRYRASLTNMAVCNYALENYTQVDNLTTTAVNKNLASAMTYLVRGNAKEMNQEFSEACEDWHKAVDLGMTDILPLITNFCKTYGNTK